MPLPSPSCAPAAIDSVIVGMAREPRNPSGNDGLGTAVIAKTKPQVKRPPLYRVLLLNDDYTPMEFVILVLQKFFKMGREKATHVMLKVHREGKGICGLFPRDIAATKVEQVCSFARQHQHPLQCVMEEA